jgi:hypothetical protein
MVITLDTSRFTIGAGDTSTTYRLDGSTTTFDTATGRATAKAAWNGDKLVIETTIEGANGQTSQTTSYYLEGEWLVRETQTSTLSRKTYFKR